MTSIVSTGIDVASRIWSWLSQMGIGSLWLALLVIGTVIVLIFRALLKRK